MFFFELDERAWSMQTMPRERSQRRFIGQFRSPFGRDGIDAEVRAG
jgi:hypothetical protein